MPLLHNQAPPNAVAFVLAHLLPLAGSPAALGAERWTAGMVLPYRMVRRVTGGRTQDADYPVIRVHTFGTDYTEASREADRTDQRMLVLEDNPSTDVVMADGSLANCIWLECPEGPHEEPYAAKSVVTRFVAEYHLGLAFVAVS